MENGINSRLLMRLRRELSASLVYVHMKGKIKMKLKDGVIITQNDNEYIIVTAGEAGKAFSGMIRLNGTAAYIAECLEEEISEVKLVDALLKKYEVSEEIATKSVSAVVEKLSSVGLIE